MLLTKFSFGKTSEDRYEEVQERILEQRMMDHLQSMTTVDGETRRFIDTLVP